VRAPKTAGLIVLGVLAVAQLVALGYRQSQIPTGVGQRLMAGGSVRAIEAHDRTPRPTTLITAQPTLLLVFHSECAFCAKVAPTWRAWLEGHGREARTIAVSAEPFALAAAYAAEHWPGAEVRTVSAEVLGGAGHALTSRTPWLFLIDAAGTIVAEGHGDRIEELGGLLLEQTRAAAASE
jgi:hypothetical protein